jgi:hypothetical protein
MRLRELFKSRKAQESDWAMYNDVMQTRAVADALSHSDWTVSNVPLGEARTVTDHVFGGLTYHGTLDGVFLGYSKALPTTELTHIDTGVLTIGPDEATFVGVNYTRTWRYDKIVGYWYDTNGLHIGCYGQTHTAAVHISPAMAAAFWAAYMRYFGYHTMVDRERQMRVQEAIAATHAYNAIMGNR